MIVQRLLRRRHPLPQPTGSIPAGQRIYAIGDIHGRLDLLDALLNAIDTDDLQRGTCGTQIIFLGDLVDRGPDSAGVVQRALSLQNVGRIPCRYLLGNHEEVFLRALNGDLKALQFFCRIGGVETLLSYGIPLEEYRALDYPELLEQLVRRVPVAHLKFLNHFEDIIIVGDYAFVHAGISPARALNQQKPSDLRWIRHEFHNHTGPLEKIIVHGHTITKDIDVQPYRIGLDTGAYASGKLTAMGFEADQRWTLDTSTL